MEPKGVALLLLFSGVLALLLLVPSGVGASAALAPTGRPPRRSADTTVQRVEQELESVTNVYLQPKCLRRDIQAFRRAHGDVVVSASGGGVRAAVVTITTLNTLADLGTFDAVSTVAGLSGGAWGVSLFRRYAQHCPRVWNMLHDRTVVPPDCWQFYWDEIQTKFGEPEKFSLLHAGDMVWNARKKAYADWFKDLEANVLPRTFENYWPKDVQDLADVGSSLNVHTKEAITSSAYRLCSFLQPYSQGPSPRWGRRKSNQLPPLCFSTEIHIGGTEATYFVTSDGFQCWRSVMTVDPLFPGYCSRRDREASVMPASRCAHCMPDHISVEEMKTFNFDLRQALALSSAAWTKNTEALKVKLTKDERIKGFSTSEDYRDLQMDDQGIHCNLPFNPEWGNTRGSRTILMVDSSFPEYRFSGFKRLFTDSPDEPWQNSIPNSLRVCIEFWGKQRGVEVTVEPLPNIDDQDVPLKSVVHLLKVKGWPNEVRVLYVYASALRQDVEAMPNDAKLQEETLPSLFPDVKDASVFGNSETDPLMIAKHFPTVDGTGYPLPLDSERMKKLSELFSTWFNTILCPALQKSGVRHLHESFCKQPTPSVKPIQMAQRT